MNREKECLIAMFEQNKISREDYQLLSAAIDKKSPVLSPLFSMLINPFQKIAGIKALLMGLAVLAGMSYLGVFAKVYFTDIFNFNYAPFFKNHVQPTFILLFYQNLICWLLLSGLFIVAAKIFHQKRIRIIDFFGTVALAKFPTLILVALTWVNQIIDPSVTDITSYTKEYHFNVSIIKYLFGLISLICFIWQVTSYFYALKESSGLIGKKLWSSFIVAILSGEMIANIFTLMPLK